MFYSVVPCCSFSLLPTDTNHNSLRGRFLITSWTLGWNWISQILSVAWPVSKLLAITSTQRCQQDIFCKKKSVYNIDHWSDWKINVANKITWPLRQYGQLNTWPLTSISFALRPPHSLSDTIIELLSPPWPPRWHEMTGFDALLQHRRLTDQPH